MEKTFSDKRLVDHFLSALQEVPDTTAHITANKAGSNDNRVDTVIKAQIGGKSVLLLVETKRSAFPRDVREAVWQLRSYLAHQSPAGDQFVPMVIAESISPGARSVLREEHVGYYDTGGSLYVPAPGAFLFVDKPIPKRQARSLNALFTGRRAQVLHAVWKNREGWFGVHEIAKLASASPTTASETLIALERREWVISKGSGPAKERHLSDPRALLDAWAAHQTTTRPTPLRHYYVPTSKIADVILSLDRASTEHRTNYYITGAAAAQTYSPYLSDISQLQCHLATGPAAEAVLESLEARPVRQGWNLGVTESKSVGDFSFRQRINDAWFADPLQTYLDLLQGGGRSKEMAEHLRSERLIL
jgi:hypothetical protein